MMRRCVMWGRGALWGALVVLAPHTHAEAWGHDAEFEAWLGGQRFQTRRVGDETQIRRREFPAMSIVPASEGEVLLVTLPVPMAVRSREWDVFLAARSLGEGLSEGWFIRYAFDAVVMGRILPPDVPHAERIKVWPQWMRDVDALFATVNRWTTLPRRPPDPFEVWPLELAPGVVMELMWIPSTTSTFWQEFSGGRDTFRMGSPDEETGREEDEPAHDVRIEKGFWLGRYEVTEAQYAAVMGQPGRGVGGGSHLPVQRIRGSDMQSFFNRLNQRSVAKGFRLPSELEWEFACRAGSESAFAFGDTLDPSRANLYRYGEESKVMDVGSFPPNAWGLYDLHGNVAEWVQDRYGAYPVDQVSRSAVVQGQGPRVFRGGSHLLGARYGRSAFRGAVDDQTGQPGIGFRVARDPVP
ncbi:MAG TPA: formylglycine-generating enzyme family protein [Kiritimatiellia bacterium]|nr:formylglycine-generating enzyme family protein [Kiritimatiellia bacterium]